MTHILYETLIIFKIINVFENILFYKIPFFTIFYRYYFLICLLFLGQHALFLISCSKVKYFFRVLRDVRKSNFGRIVYMNFKYRYYSSQVGRQKASKFKLVECKDTIQGYRTQNCGPNWFSRVHSACVNFKCL